MRKSRNPQIFQKSRTQVQIKATYMTSRDMKQVQHRGPTNLEWPVHLTVGRLSMIGACELIHISVPKSTGKYHNYAENIRHHGIKFSRRDHQTPGIRAFLYETKVTWHIQKLWARSCPWKVPFIIAPFLSPSVRMKFSNSWIFFRIILTFGDIIDICSVYLSWRRCVRLTTLPPSCAVVMKSENLNFLEPSGPLQACNGTAALLQFTLKPANNTRHCAWRPELCASPTLLAKY